jgi:predicted nucleic acid-binding protein
MPYLDSNVFIYPVIYQADEPKAKRAKQILQNIESGKTNAYTSTLTWDEVVWVVSRTLNRSEGINQGRKLLDFPNLKLIPADSQVLSRAQRLIEKHKIKPRDAIHVASALERKNAEIISDDSELEAIKEIVRIPL